MYFKNILICMKIVVIALILALMWFLGSVAINLLLNNSSALAYIIVILIVGGFLVSGNIFAHIIELGTPTCTENKYAKFSIRMLARRYASLENAKSLFISRMRTNREEYFEIATTFFDSYNDIGKDLRFSNKYCRAELWANGTTITLRDKTNPSRVFKITRYIPTEESDLICIFCERFDNETTFDDLLAYCTIEFGVKGEFSEQTTNQNNTADISEQFDNKKKDVNQKLARNSERNVDL